MKNKGYTMVEVLVGFCLLFILFSSLLKVVQVSGNMMMEAEDVLRQQQGLQEQYYRKGHGGMTCVSGGKELYLLETDEEGNPLLGAISLRLDDDLAVMHMSSGEEGMELVVIEKAKIQ